MSEWEPISTRHRTGPWEVILVTDGKVVKAVEDYGDGYWDLKSWGYDGHEELDFAPTHWMPLPKAPEQN